MRSIENFMSYYATATATQFINQASSFRFWLLHCAVAVLGLGGNRRTRSRSSCTSSAVRGHCSRLWFVKKGEGCRIIVMMCALLYLLFPSCIVERQEEGWIMHPLQPKWKIDRYSLCLPIHISLSLAIVWSSCIVDYPYFLSLNVKGSQARASALPKIIRMIVLREYSSFFLSVIRRKLKLKMTVRIHQKLKTSYWLYFFLPS